MMTSLAYLFIYLIIYLCGNLSLSLGLVLFRSKGNRAPGARAIKRAELGGSANAKMANQINAKKKEAD
jgi:hypothetical protein